MKNKGVKNYSSAFLFFLIIISSYSIFGQKDVPSDKVLPVNEIADYLKLEIRNRISANSQITEQDFAKYFRQKFSERFFYNWQDFKDKFTSYNQIYNQQDYHEQRAQDHLSKFDADTKWKLPFNYKNQTPVDAYAYRHLSRQHKMLDIAYNYFYDNKDPKYIQYFTIQRNSLNKALHNNLYEKTKDGNGVYEVFRSGYRILNWLSIHNMFLGEDDYSDEDQLTTIATLLQHAAHLYNTNDEYSSGNHQTRGMSALAMLSILFRDFESSTKWYQRAIQRLEEHLEKEINKDGFQFERSTQYHIHDIDNYFYVYQLAKINELEISNYWEEKLKSLFTTLVKIAYPNKLAPVLQDDADNPWSEYNEISETLTLGYLLFQDAEFGYFAAKNVSSDLFWFLSSEKLDQLNSVNKTTPKYGSIFFPDTKYYIMREGWDKNNKMMIISAGVEKEKPDHQHGDVLGIQAMANGKVILPNYQVRYPLPDYNLFKNSLVKNVALVDNELQGKVWTSNAGKTGFGKFNELPEPIIISWESNLNFDFFAGSHNGFTNIGVEYSRQVIYVKDDFWIVKDNFNSDTPHDYKQIWQGHYTTEGNSNLIRTTFPDASGCDIFQLIPIDDNSTSGTRGKEWNTVTKNDTNKFNFVTIVFPYSGYNNRLNELANEDINFGDWKSEALPFTVLGENLRAITKLNKSFLFNVSTIQVNGNKINFSEINDVFIEVNKTSVVIHSLGVKEVDTIITGSKFIVLDNKFSSNSFTLLPGSVLELKN